jgi:hypothetical protein
MSKKEVKARIEKLEISSPGHQHVLIREFGGPYKGETFGAKGATEEEFNAWCKTLPPEDKVLIVEIVENKPPRVYPESDTK